MDRAMVDETHTADGPVIVPAVGRALMANIFDEMAVPQLLLTVYWMVSVPDEMAVTRPELETVALAFVALQVPAVALTLKLLVAPTHNELRPVIVPAFGAGLTVSVAMAVQPVPKV